MCRFSSRFRWLGRACATLLIAGSALGGEVYEWVGPDGVTRYTIRRGEARRFVIPPPEEEPGSLAPSSPTAPASAEPEMVLVPAARVRGTLPKPTPTKTLADPAGVPEIQAALPAATSSGLPPEPVPTAEARAATPLPTAAAVVPGPRQKQIQALEASIAADRATLKELISRPSTDAAEFATSAEIREIGERLPRLQAELAALREAGP